MNYIKQLEQSKAELDATRHAINEFLCFLNTGKFIGTESDGGRKDWIATSDVTARLIDIRNIGV